MPGAVLGSAESKIGKILALEADTLRNVHTKQPASCSEMV